MNDDLIHLDEFEQSQVAYESGGIVPVVDFDFASIDGDPVNRSVNEYRNAAIRLLHELDRVLGLIIESKNPRLMAHCIALAFGRNHLVPCKTFDDLGHFHGVTRAAISKKVIEIQRSCGSNILGIGKMPGQKSSAAGVTYRKARLKQLSSKGK